MDSSEQAMELLHLLRCCGHYLHHNWGSGKISQNRTLHILVDHGEVTQRQLQDIMGIQQGSLSEVVKKLEAQDLIVREREQNDQRQILVRVTEKGREQNRANCEKRMQQSKALVAVLSSEEQRQLQLLLAKLYDSWRDWPNPECSAHCRCRTEERQVAEEK